MSTRSFRGVRIIRFGEFELDVRAAELRQNGRRIRLQEQPFRILAMLLEHPGEVVLREDIRRKLWPNGTIVEVGHGINAAVLRLREALGESAENPRYVETLARRGYRFAGQPDVVYKERVEPVPDSPEPLPVRPKGSASGPAVAPFDTGDLRGKTISHYQVIEKVGGGGMGVVYRAADLKLGRHVALKFLPQELAGDPAALGRFQREARAASALNHPNICTVYGVEEYCGQPLIVMEMLEGETLEAKLAKGPLPVSKALTMAIQMADALDAAHHKGIVHRDLKPGNVLVTRSGVKVLDFGLAKIARAVAMGNEDGSHVTEEGAILGTLHYMSPEQVQGKEADRSSDIFSFGLVLYEMLAGKRAFPGENSAAVMAAILTAEPPEIREPIVPAGLDRVLERCLAKDPEERWHTACDLKAALEWIAAGWAPGTPPPAPAPTVPPPQAPAAPSPPVATMVAAPAPRRVPKSVYLIAGGTLCYLLFAAGSRQWETAPEQPGVSSSPPAALASPAVASITTSRQPTATAFAVSQAVTRFTVWAPNNGTVTRVNLSPDGRSIAFVSRGQISVRSFDSLEPRVLEGTKGAGTPFWSPDGHSLAFPSGGKLKTIRVDGGLPLTLCDVNTNLAGAWGPDGTIIIVLIGAGLYRVPVATKILTRLTTVDPARNEMRHLLPQFLPDGRRFLFVAGAKVAADNMLYAGSLDSPERTPIMQVSSGVQFVASRREGPPGYLVFARDRILMAQAFDPAKLRTLGDAFPVAGPVVSNAAAGAEVGVVDFSTAGATLAYRSTGTRDAPANPTGIASLMAMTMKDVGNIVVVQNWMSGLKK